MKSKNLPITMKRKIVMTYVFPAITMVFKTRLKKEIVEKLRVAVKNHTYISERI